jgi:hypothetical protein
MLIPKFDVKGRAYYGTTSMESEMSLLMSGQTLVRTIHHRTIDSHPTRSLATVL